MNIRLVVSRNSIDLKVAIAALKIAHPNLYVVRNSGMENDSASADDIDNSANGFSLDGPIYIAVVEWQ